MMIKEIKKSNENKKKYFVYDVNDNIINKFSISIKTIENKFDDSVLSFVNNVILKFPDVNKKLFEMFTMWSVYESKDEVKKEFENLFNIAKPYIDEYVDSMDIDKFSDRSKKTKNSIFIESETINKLIKMSCYMKMYTLFFDTTNKFKDESLTKDVFQLILNINNANDALSLLYELIKKKLSTFKYTDKGMWLFIKLHHSKNYDIFVNELFNFILGCMLTIYEVSEDRNIITFLVVFVERKITWLIYDSYQTNIVLMDSLTEDDNNSISENFIDTGFKSDFIKQCSYNNTISYITSITEKFLTDNKIDPLYTEIRCNEMFVTPLQRFFVLPIINKITNIEYNYLLYRDKYQIYTFQIYLYYMFNELFLNKYRHLCELLMYGAQKPINDSTNINLKKTPDILKSKLEFYGLHNKAIFIRLITSISTMTTRKNRLTNILYEHMKNVNINQSYIDDLIKFFNNFFIDGKNSDMEILSSELIKQIKNLK